MGPFAAAILVASLEGLKWLFAATAALLVVLTVTQFVRGDAEARPLVNLALGLGFAALAGLARIAALRVEAARRR